MAYGGFSLPAEKLNIEDIMGIPLIEAYGHYMKEMIRFPKLLTKSMKLTYIRNLILLFLNTVSK